jgi:hypothetical protein
MPKTRASAKELKGLRPLELHYFRVPRERWELMLIRLRQMGANAVSTVVPWAWHEPQDGRFDLTGLTHPGRDVATFLETCQALGFQVILQVSPCAGAGLLGGGVPGWLLQEHPEMWALGADSQPRRDPASGSPLPCAEHPTYLKYLERWFQELSGALAAHQPPAGPIVSLRVDRLGLDDSAPQTGAIPGGWDYNLHVVKVQWPVWLRQQYAGIETLNAAWKSDYRSYNDAAFPPPPTTPGTSSRSAKKDQRLADAARFVVYTAGHATLAYASLLRQMGWNVPIAADRDALPGPLEAAHAVQVDPEPPQLGAGLRWAMHAPVRADGSPRRQFWQVKATLLDMAQGVKPVAGGILVTGSESRRLRLPRPAGDYGVYRLLLDGGLLDVPGRARGEALQLDYVAADEAGETDMYVMVNDRSAPLTGFLREYLACLLMGRAHTLSRAGALCQAAAEAFAGTPPLAGHQEAHMAAEDLLTAEQSLAEARQAARRAAASLGRLERLAGEIRGEIPPIAPGLPVAAAFSPQELERLAVLRDACAQAGPALSDAAQSIQALCQAGGPDAPGLTLDAYRAAFGQAQTAAWEAAARLGLALGGLRADLASGSLSPAAWPLQDWLARTLQGLTVGWLEIGPGSAPVRRTWRREELYER